MWRYGLMVLTAAFPLWAQSAEPQFPERIELADTELALAGSGTFRYRGLFRVYAAAFYVSPGTPPARVLAADVPKRLELVYQRAVSREAFIQAGEAVLARTLAPPALSKIRPALDTLHRHYRDVADGDRYSLTYLPGRGTTLHLNGQALVTLDDPAFTAAYFAIWVGGAPIDGALRRQLLQRLPSERASLQPTVTVPSGGGAASAG
ncbi:MAG: chalcone isomerase family protein [Gammaproteobacteria bacterium]